ncbi:DNA primase [Paenirhodobacter sp.]|uniref:DNA primase n=1 Tax=Paenirhodobacter sp. TaxID=1965326 RepID=UPI003B4277F3
MSLPPGFLDELRNRVSISQVVGRKVVWDSRKSNQAKGDMWAPCPFHQEKSASFHVDDRKGFYHCFGCHASGDALKFVQETENVSFMEAVEILAREAGMQMPARDAREAERADHRTELTRVMEEAVKHFRLSLSMQAGAEARTYLQRRGLSPETIARFEIGFAPDGWQGLWDALKAKGIADDLILGAGLAKPSTKGGKPYDVFRNRIMFPIRDPRGRCIAFGGRAMDPKDNAKYLNSPETALFDKGRTLFNHGPAREAAGKGARLIVCEGYMDVIALVQAGFGGAVAPLGTAVTEEQLHLMWRIHDEPVIALDGDAAGVKAALRVIDLALPLLEAGKGLRFAMLPQGQDPDEVIKAAGPQAMQKVLDGARPMVDLLWQRETEGQVFDSPERRAALDKKLRAAIERIRDPSIKTHYGAEVKRLREALFGFSRPAWKPFVKGARPPVQPLPTTRSTLLVAAQGPEVTDHLREAVVLAILATHPRLIAEYEARLEGVRFADPAHERLCRLMLSLAHDPEVAARLPQAAGGDLENLLAQPHVRTVLVTSIREDADYASHCLAADLAKLTARRALEQEIAEAREDIEGLADEGVTWRLAQAAKAFEQALKPTENDDRATVRAENGVELDKEELEQSRAFYDSIDFSRGGRGSRRN